MLVYQRVISWETSWDDMVKWEYHGIYDGIFGSQNEMLWSNHCVVIIFKNMAKYV
jgi:hypothetical protein